MKKENLILMLSMIAIVGLNVFTGRVLLGLSEITTQQEKTTSILTIVFNLGLSLAIGCFAASNLLKKKESE